MGALRTIVGSTDTERRVVINATGPFWDGNEVWLIVGRHVRGVPAWYATIFSGLYLALVLVLLALMARGVSFEYRGKSTDARWQRAWTTATVISSVLIPGADRDRSGGSVGGPCRSIAIRPTRATSSICSHPTACEPG